METRRKTVWVGGLVAGFMALGWGGLARSGAAAERGFASNVIVPQARAFALDRHAAASITEVNVGVVILEQVATTTMDIALSNPSAQRLEAELVVPVPEGAVVRGFTFQGAAKEPTAQLLPREEARRSYDAIVAKVRDPALLEFVGYSLVRSSVFPIEPHGTQKLRLSYEHVLAADGDRIDYLLPRSESLDATVPWKISVKIKSARPVATAYSPSHRIDSVRPDANSISVRVADGAAGEPGPFRLSYLLARDGVSASLFAYPDAKAGGGYFLLLAGAPAADTDGREPGIRREVTLVLDRSGSMAGEKLNQVREAARQVIAGLEEGESFNLIAYNDTVRSFAPAPVLKTAASVERAAAFLKDLTAQGSTDLHSALSEALRPKPAEERLPIVLFLTDGLPTTGQTSEVAIREVATKTNPHNRRVFTFGVGVDVNTPLLEKIASETRATASFVLPGEDVEVKVASVFKRLTGPVLAGPELRMPGPEGRAGAARVQDLVPARLPDLFAGDQLVVVGRYTGDAPLDFSLSGNYRGRERSFRFSFDLGKASVRNAFVPRLWASRKIAVLIDAIRQLGADARPGRPVTDPRVRELVDEIARLSIEFGILTEYTAFLAREGTDLSRKDEVLAQAARNFETRAMHTRVGLGSVNQSANTQAMAAQQELNFRNAYYDENMNRVAVTTVQQVNDLAFFRRGSRWVDSRIVTRERETKPARTVEFGSEEFRKLAARLASEGRQGSVALRGDVLMVVDGEPVLVKGPPSP